MRRRPDAQSAAPTLPATKSVNKLVLDSPPSVTSFAAAAGQKRRRLDQEVAVALRAGGLREDEIYLLPDAPGAEDQVVACEGGDTESWGRPLRRSQLFPSQAWARQISQAATYAAFCQRNYIQHVHHVRVASPVSVVPLDHLRPAHRQDSKRLWEVLREVVRAYALEGMHVDIVAAHVSKDGPFLGYLHFHLAVRARVDDLAVVRDYFLCKGWDWYDDTDKPSDLPPEALANYIGRGIGGDIVRGENWTPRELATVFRALRGISTTRAAGPFRRFVGQLKVDRQRAVFDRDCVLSIVHMADYRPQIRRSKEKLFSSAGFSVRALIRHDFGDGIPKAAWVVRGRRGLTAADLSAAGYELTPNTGDTGDTAIPESARISRPAIIIDTDPRPPDLSTPPDDPIPW